MLTASDLPDIDPALALRVIAVARSIAPCIITLPDGDDRDTAIAILQGVAADAESRGSRHVKSERIGPSSVEWVVDSSWFFSDDVAALRTLCSSTSGSGSGPVGSFPAAGHVAGLWPEGIYPS